MPSDDPGMVKAQYAREDNLKARRNLYDDVSGPHAPDVLWQTLVDLAPARVLEVGGGPGELAERMQRELGAAVSFIDLSPRMVELAREQGVDAQLGDVQQLPFDDRSFDTVVAAWMLYHVPDVAKGLSEIARVLEPRGTLVAVTSSVHHLQELRELIGYDWRWFARSFNRENGEESLAQSFAHVGRVDLETLITVHEREKLVAYRESLSQPSQPVPDDVELPFLVHGRTTIFVATK
jgi:SAM-dependent methyltransferase